MHPSKYTQLYTFLHDNGDTDCPNWMYIYTCYCTVKTMVGRAHHFVSTITPIAHLVCCGRQNGGLCPPLFLQCGISVFLMPNALVMKLDSQHIIHHCHCDCFSHSLNHTNALQEHHVHLKSLWMSWYLAPPVAICSPDLFPELSTCYILHQCQKLLKTQHSRPASNRSFVYYNPETSMSSDVVAWS